jgi:hypothetical protein
VLSPLHQRRPEPYRGASLDVALDALDQAERYRGETPMARVLNLVARHQLEQYIEDCDVP